MSRKLPPLKTLQEMGLLARIAELEARAEHDEDNLEGLQHALVRANQRYTRAEADLAECRQYQGWTQFVGQRERAEQAEAALAKLKDAFEILATKLSEANAELVRLETQPRSD